LGAAGGRRIIAVSLSQLIFVAHEIHAIAVKTERVLQLVDLNRLQQLGVDTARYETFDHAATQAIAAAAHFLGFDGLLVPSARFSCANLVLFTDRISGTGHLHLIGSEDIDWIDWRKRTRRA
jgi:RES domain